MSNVRSATSIIADMREGQVMEMKKAFAAGAISGLQLATNVAFTDKSPREKALDIQAHVAGIKTLAGIRP